MVRLSGWSDKSGWSGSVASLKPDNLKEGMSGWVLSLGVNKQRVAPQSDNPDKPDAFGEIRMKTVKSRRRISIVASAKPAELSPMLRQARDGREDDHAAARAVRREGTSLVELHSDRGRAEAERLATLDDEVIERMEHAIVVQAGEDRPGHMDKDGTEQSGAEGSPDGGSG